MTKKPLADVQSGPRRAVVVDEDEAPITIQQHTQTSSNDKDDDDDDEYEKKYENILNHRPLRNGTEHAMPENYYAHQMKCFAKNGQVSQ
jgi:hypothetical protein